MRITKRRVVYVVAVWHVDKYVLKQKFNSIKVARMEKKFLEDIGHGDVDIWKETTELVK